MLRVPAQAVSASAPMHSGLRFLPVTFHFSPQHLLRRSLSFPVKSVQNRTHTPHFFASALYLRRNNPDLLQALAFSQVSGFYVVYLFPVFRALRLDRQLLDWHAFFHPPVSSCHTAFEHPPGTDPARQAHRQYCIHWQIPHTAAMQTALPEKKRHRPRHSCPDGL